MIDRLLKISFLLLLSFQGIIEVRGQHLREETIHFFVTPTLPQNLYGINRIPIDTGGVSVPKDTLFQLLEENGNPISYYRRITTEVCFDGTCRLLRVNLYWNITGRYLGFELPPNEFLSKKEHEPFNRTEYLQLNAILADSVSPIGHFDYQALIPKDVNGEQIDGVTRATSTDLMQYVVDGAVFTTYTMWNLIYGKMQRDVELATESALNPNLLLDILNSSDLWDQYWALDRLTLLTDVTLDLKNKVFSLMCNESYNLAERAIETLPRSWCEDRIFQQRLWATFDCIQYSLKPKVLEKLGMCKKLDRSILIDIADRLSVMNGPMLVASLECLRRYGSREPIVLQRVAALLDHKNQYVANQAKKFLDEIDVIK